MNYLPLRVIPTRPHFSDIVSDESSGSMHGICIYICMYVCMYVFVCVCMCTVCTQYVHSITQYILTFYLTWHPLWGSGTRGEGRQGRRSKCLVTLTWWGKTWNICKTLSYWFVIYY